LRLFQQDSYFCEALTNDAFARSKDKQPLDSNAVVICGTANIELGDKVAKCLGNEIGLVELK
jgi:hypothetical protein